MKITKYILFLLLVPSIAFSAPNPTGVSGTWNSGNSVGISGSNFGSGPTVQIFDDFEGTAGQSISFNANYGTWTSSSHNPIYDSNSHSGNTGFRIYDTTNVIQRQLQKDFSGVTEAFISYWVLVPDGTLFPSKTSAPISPGQFSNASNWKMIWLNGAGTYPYANDDICLPTWIGYFRLSGNDLTDGVNLDSDGVRYKDSNWVWGEWQRFTIWLKAGTVIDVDDGTWYFQGLCSTNGMWTKTVTWKPIFDGGGGTYDPLPQEWTRFAVPGWVRYPAYQTDTYKVRPVYDDVYIATGANANARVEIGDNATYTSCTNLSLLTPTSWGDSSITAKLNFGSFADSATVYVFVTDANNTTSSGYQVTLGTGYDVPTDTSAPTPDPAVFSTDPYGLSTTEIKMDYSFSDNTPPVLVDIRHDPNGDSCSAQCGSYFGTAGTDLSWTAGTSYTDSGFGPAECACYDIQARDSVGTPNTNTRSNIKTAWTNVATPGQPILGDRQETTLLITNNANGNPAWVEYCVQMLYTSPADSDWQDKYVDTSGNPSATPVYATDTVWDAVVVGGGTTPLNSATLYGIKIRGKNTQTDEMSDWSVMGYGTTLGEPDPNDPPSPGKTRSGGVESGGRG